MPSHPAIPPLLSPYINPPSASLNLLTSTLGATTNWLVLRIIHAALKRIGHSSISNNDPSSTDISVGETRVVLVSWLRDANFWKDGGRKLAINFQEVHIIDTLTHTLGLGPDALKNAEGTIMKAISQAIEATRGAGKVLLILDGLDFLLAATGCSVLEVLNTIGELRECVHSTVITSCADLALIQSPSTPLETSHVAFAMNMAHQATLIMSVKGLDTGFARDVSGVLRVNRGPGADLTDTDVEEKEYLYFVEGDGGVRVFERGT